jgi:predicted small lipoprotein YifL
MAQNLLPILITRDTSRRHFFDAAIRSGTICYLRQHERRIRMTIMRKFVLPAMAGIVMLAGLAACDREGPMERAGEKVDESVEKAGDKMEKATDK